MSRNTGVKWIPEAPTFPGLYALETPERRGKLGTELHYGTHSVYDAVQHDDREACQAWCDKWNTAHPEVGGGRAWAPVEHEFVAAPSAEGAPA